MWWAEGWRRFFAEVNKASGTEIGLYWWILIGIGHVFLGSLFCFIPPLIVAVSYWLIKERRDKRFRDGLVDTLAVTVGSTFPAEYWMWPWLIAAGLAAAITVFPLVEEKRS